MALPINYKRINQLLKKLGLQMERLAVERDLPDEIKSHVLMKAEDRQYAFQIAISVIEEITNHLLIRMYNQDLMDPWSAFQFLAKEKIITYDCINGILKIIALNKEIKHYYWVDYEEEIKTCIIDYLLDMENFSSQIINLLVENPPDEVKRKEADKELFREELN
jgi:uncharacterized protein YutE (UPF0331/DUF86 family)